MNMPCGASEGRTLSRMTQAGSRAGRAIATACDITAAPAHRQRCGSRRAALPVSGQSSPGSYPRPRSTGPRHAGSRYRNMVGILRPACARATTHPPVACSTSTERRAGKRGRKPAGRQIYAFRAIRSRRVRQRKSANVFELADVRRDGASYRLVQRGYR